MANQNLIFSAYKSSVVIVLSSMQRQGLGNLIYMKNIRNYNFPC
jgi:hypothetical protein